MVQGKINKGRQTDHPDGRATPSGLSSAHLHHHQPPTNKEKKYCAKTDSCMLATPGEWLNYSPTQQMAVF